MSVASNQLPAEGYVREWQLVGSAKRGIVGVLPFGRTTFRQKIKDGNAPAPIKLGGRIAAWKVEDIRAYLAELGGAQ
jgi:predicted DNA-binding transcriptional regulator AlpA